RGDLRQQAQAMGVLGQMIIVEASFDKVPALLKSADILLNPRLVCPGVPQKLLNYMAAGRPIVSFAGSGRILEHGKTGLLVYDNCPEGFARGLLQVIGDAELGRKLGTGAQTYAAQRLSWSVAAEMLETAFDAALAERSN
ncbi:MAG TPA: glycosyltransferase, partial [Alphaproteobacteria bacterium]|nr:glycosyltransferase [Alphaproteobacteria bacterium]